MLNIVITGSSTGIGKTTAELLARAGYRVFATMRNTKDGEPLLDMAKNENLQIEVVSLDVADDDSVDHAFAAIYRQVEFIDVLICNAGITGFGTVEETPLQKFHDCMNINCLGAVRCVKKVITAMRERQQGCIITVSSAGGRVALSPNAPYSASKFALEAFSEALAQEAKTFGVKVAIVQPGSTATPIADKTIKGSETQSVYPQPARLLVALENFADLAEPPEIVADQIKVIIENDSWQLRYPVGDTKPLLDMRNNLSDEEWVHLQSLSGEAYDKAMEKLLSGNS